MSTNLTGAPDIRIAQLVDRFFRRIHAGLHSRAPEFDKDGIGPGGSMILLTIQDLQPTPIYALVTHLARDKSQITRALKSLEAKGLVRREPAQEDGRVVVVALTEKGQRMVETLQAVMAETIGEILAPLAEDDRAALETLLDTVVPSPQRQDPA